MIHALAWNNKSIFKTKVKFHFQNYMLFFLNNQFLSAD